MTRNKNDTNVSNETSNASFSDKPDGIVSTWRIFGKTNAVVWKRRKSKILRSSDINVAWKRRKNKKISRNCESNLSWKRNNKIFRGSDMEAWKRRKKKNMLRTCVTKDVWKRRKRKVINRSRGDTSHITRLPVFTCF